VLAEIDKEGVSCTTPAALTALLEDTARRMGATYFI
jgi:hypothetical protein